MEEIANNQKIDISAFGTTLLNVRANTDGGPIDYVRFGLNGNPNFHAEGVAPYSLAGDINIDDYLNWDYELDIVYYLKATPYCNGKTGTPLNISFTLTKSPPPTSAAVVSFSLIDAASNTVLVDEIANNQSIDISACSTTLLNVRANTAGGPIDYVRFGLNDNPNFRTEGVAPYSLAGDIKQSSTTT